MNKTYAFIFARGGSKGLPDKNVLPFGGIPLLAHGIRLARKLSDVEEIFVSTESHKIASIAESEGAVVIQRPEYLATDTSPEWLSWQHAVKYVQECYGNFDRFLSLPPTAPLRSIDDVQRCLDALQPHIDVVVTMSDAHRSPWFNMVRKNSFGCMELVNLDSSISRRQDAPDCFDMTTVAYVSRPDFICNALKIWDGKVAGVSVPVERAVDIDTPLDFAIAQFLFNHSS